MGRLGLLGCLGALVLILLIGGGWYIGVRNHFVELDQQVQAQWAQVENDYQRRFDLVPNLVRTVQGAANFEKSTLEAVINARSRVGQVQAPAGGPPGTQSNLPNDPNALALDIPPKPTQWVNDYNANLLNASQIQQLNEKLEGFYKKTGVQFLIMIFPSLEGEDDLGYTNKVANVWKINSDKAVMLFVFAKEHKTRIQVGYG